MKSSATFSTIANNLRTVGGFPARDLLPLIPPGAVLSDNTKVKPEQIGKIPGRFAGGKWSGLSGPWPTFGLAERDQIAAAQWPTQNVGLRAADFPGIDIDTNSKEALELAEGLVTNQFGGGLPARERGGAPRVLFPFRRVGEAQVRKHRIEFTDSDGTGHAVEVLGLGQQYVVSGIHPTGAAFEWREQRNGSGAIIQGDLVAYKSSGLPPITADDVGQFMSTLQSAILGRGWTVTSIHAPKFGSGGRGEGILVSKAEAVIDPKLALEALTSFPNTSDSLPRREDLVSILSSFKNAVGKEAEEHRAEVGEWATKHGWADPEYFEKIWESLTTARVSPDHLLFVARKFGWRGDAVLDFKEFGDDGDEGGGGGGLGADMDEKIRKAQRESESKQPQLEALANKLVYCAEEQIFIITDTGEALSAEALNNAPQYGVTVADAGSSGKNSAANRLRNQAGLLREVKGMVYLPGKPQLTNWTKEGRASIFYNRWHPHLVSLPDAVNDDDVKPWLDHVAYLVPDETERSLLLDFFAHIVQRRGEKVRWAPLIVGKQGTGKDLMIKPLLMFFSHNARDIKPEQLTARFNNFLENELLVVQEMKKTNKTSGVYNSIKTLLAGTADDINYVEQKYKSPYAVPNVVNSVFFSNHPDCIDMDPEDRRFLIIMSDAEKKAFDYYVQLAERFYRAQSGWRKVIRWLMQRDLTGFDASRPPAQTIGKEAFMEGQRSVLYMALHELLTKGDYKDRVAVTANEVYQKVKFDFNVQIDTPTRNEIKNVAMISTELGHLGWHKRENVRVSDDVIRPWSRPGTNPTPKEIRLDYDAAHGKGAVSGF
jgi:hypothetical protein